MRSSSSPVDSSVGAKRQQRETYPDPAVDVLDPRFLKYRITNAAVERLATGMRFGEGPVTAASRYGATFRTQSQPVASFRHAEDVTRFAGSSAGRPSVGRIR
jgi:hypothetical protein